jgi:hypothetical protein
MEEIIKKTTELIERHAEYPEFYASDVRVISASVAKFLLSQAVNEAVRLPLTNNQ